MINCWELMQCGREPGGAKDGEFGVCPASIAENYHGVNQGRCAGRFCWAVTGTLCKGNVQGTMAHKALDCMECEFYAQVVKEHRQLGRPLVINPSQLA
jgi:hypothetical protein